ncbi:MAG: hypothetical protein KIT46_01030 [Anaerolineales bacterium]|nr:hypothetical protein [Anaerolineales bacterium]MCW5854606.1 hypothetical protein [Anaerolineales bacterium]
MKKPALPTLSSARLLPLAIVLAFTFLTWLVLSHAWFSDDAYFSFRSVDNFVHGHGLTWNVQERVQGFTHPLWVLLLSALYFFTREIYLTTIFVNLALALAVAWLLVFKIAASRAQGLAALGLLALSTAFIDYSSSGLENPLTHLLLAVFLWLFLRVEGGPRQLFWLCLVAALAAVNRLDTGLLYAPALLYAWWRQPQRLGALGAAALGFLPLLAWELFALVYYGFPFPNTYYAKLHNYVPLAQEVWAGLNYFWFTLLYDPLTWVVVLSAAVVVLLGNRPPRGVAVLLGMLLYLLYVLQIGGDFMGGRFLSAVYLAAVVLLAVYFLPQLSLRRYWPLIPAALLLSAVASSPPYWLYAKGFETARWQGVVDERMVYHTTNLIRIEDLYAFNSHPDYHLLNRAAYLARSLGRGTAFRWEAEHDWIELGRQLRAQAEAEGMLYLPQGANGFTGYYAGPDVYFIHGLALTDPLLSRLPPIYNPNWRSGHFMRQIPAGYLALEAGQQAALDDPALDAYYQQIRLVTQGPLFSAERWAAIWALNTRDFDDWLPGYAAQLRFPELQSVAVSGTGVELNTAFGGLGHQGVALQLEFTQPWHAGELELGLSAGDHFELVYLNAAGEELASQTLLSRTTEGIETHRVQVPATAAQAGYAALRLVPIRHLNQAADGEYLMSFIQALD